MPRDPSRPSGAHHSARSAASRRAGQVLYWCGIALLVFVMVLPFLWMVATSLMDELAVFAYPPPLVPRTARFSNYLNAWRALPFGRFYLNSLAFSLAVVVGQVTTSALAAYAFARLHFPGRDRLFVLCLGVLMVPGILLIIPRFLIIINAVGWVDTYPGIISVEVGISSFHSFYYSNWPYQMAAAVTAIAPVLLIFFLAQRYFVRGIQLTGLK
jgi:ABC-type glycerol-3-phosphate transport system permease component